MYIHAPKTRYYCEAAVVMLRGYFIPGNLVKGKLVISCIYNKSIKKKVGDFVMYQSFCIALVDKFIFVEHLFF